MTQNTCMHIRLCKKEDMESTNNICNSCWEKFYPAYLPQGTVDEMLRKRRQNPHRFEPNTKRAFRLVAEDKGEIIGFSYCKENKITAIYVDPVWTDRGVGSALIHTALKRLKANGYKTIKVSTLIKNKDALRFYQRYGFNVVGKGEQETRVIKIPVVNLELTF